MCRCNHVCKCSHILHVSITFLDIDSIFLLGDTVAFPTTPIDSASLFNIELGNNTHVAILFIDVYVSTLAIVFILEDTVGIYPPPVESEALFTIIL